LWLTDKIPSTLLIFQAPAQDKTVCSTLWH
jgi:hypothetical protein